MAQKRTPLFDIHIKAGAKIVDFAGFEMPVLYTSLIKEHQAVRSGCGIFDVSHMGEIEFSGPSAANAVQKLTTNDVKRLGDGEAHYSLICNLQGGVIDDIIVYHHSPEKIVLCVNASNTENVLAWIIKQQSEDIRFKDINFEDISVKTALIALQGPTSVEILQMVTDTNLSAIRKFSFVTGSIAGVEAVISRTGYTGEDGFELFIAPEGAATVWNAIMESGAPGSVVPVGLGARDTLRLEMGYPLHGSEMDDKTMPYEARLGWVVKLNGDDFLGKKHLKKQADKGFKRQGIAFKVTGRGIPRKGYKLLSPNGGEIGEVTSGTQTPSLKYPIGLGYVVDTKFSKLNTKIAVEIRGKAVEAVIVKTPFYKI